MPHIYLKALPAVALAACAFQMAVASDEIYADTCFPVERAFAGIADAASLDADRRDSVDSFSGAFFQDAENRTAPMTLYLKENETLDDFVISESGEVKDFHQKITTVSEATVICGASWAEGKIGLGLSSDVRFKNSSGVHTLPEILDGVRDGKKHHKKNLGGAMALFVPKMTHVAIIYDEPETTPNLSANVDSSSVPLKADPYGEMWVIEVKILENMKAETLNVGGGPYRLLPVPSIKKMKSLGIK